MPIFSYRSDTIKAISTALLEAKKEFKPVIKDSVNPFYKSKYANLPDTIEATEEALTKHGLLITQLAVSKEGHAGVATLLIHTPSEEYFLTELTLPLKELSAQAGGSAITYARRYAYQAILGIAPEDDDGAAGSGTTGHQAKVDAHKAPGKVNSAPATQGAQKPSSQNELDRAVAKAVDAAQEAHGPAQADPLPTPEQLAAFVNRCRAITKELAANKMEPNVGEKFKRYLLQQSGAADLNQISIDKYNKILLNIESLMKEPKKAIEEIERAK